MTSMLSHITATGQFGLGFALYAGNVTGAAGVAWPAANQAIYVPFYVPENITVKRLFIVNDGNNTGTNDIGIYSSSGTRLVSTGAQARTANSCNYYTVTSTALAAGDYYLAALGSSVVGTYTTYSVTTGHLKVLGVLQEAVGAATLPATMTPATVTSQVVPMIGLSTSLTV